MSSLGVSRPEPGGRALTWILVLGLGLRVMGLFWGLPSNVIPGEFPFHPDELVPYEEGGSLYSAPNPITFTWGGVFYFRLAWLARQAATSMQPGNEPEAKLLTLLMLRTVNLLFALLTGAAVQRAGAVLFGRRVGLIAAFLLLTFPAHVLESHYARPDVVQLFFATTSLVAAAQVATGAGRRWLLAGGLLAGLAIATMVWGLVALVPLAVAVLVRERYESFGTYARRVALAGAIVAAGAAAGYLLGSVESFTFWDVFQRGRQRAAAMHGASGYALPLPLVFSVAFYAFGTVATLAAYAGAIAQLGPRVPRARWIVVAHLATGLALLGKLTGEMTRYVLFLAPSIALLAAWSLHALVEALAARTARPARARAVAYVLGAIAVLQVPLGYVLGMQIGEDARYRTGRWIHARAAGSGARVGVTPSFYGDWTYVPRFPASEGIRVSEIALRSNYDASNYWKADFDFIAVSDFTQQRATGDSARAYLRTLEAGDRYRVAARFGPAWEPLVVPKLLGFLPPGDLLYVRQTFTIYERADR